MSKMNFEIFYKQLRPYSDAVLNQVFWDVHANIPETDFLRKRELRPLEFQYTGIHFAFVNLGQRLFPRSKFLEEQKERLRLQVVDHVLGVYRQNSDLSLATRFEPPVATLNKEFIEYAKKNFNPNIAQAIREGMQSDGPARQLRLEF